MFKRLFSKKSGFTLVEIIIAFAVFAIMSAMILQILNVTTLQRKSNAELSEMIDEQEKELILNGKKDFDPSQGTNGTVGLDFGENGSFEYDYQMYGTDGKGADELKGLAYFVAQHAEAITPPDDGDDDDDDDDSDDNAGAQSNRMKVRLSGVRDFDFIQINSVKLVGTDENGNATYEFDMCASASGMDNDNVPYAMYRLYFYMDGNKSTTPADIISASYISGNAIGTGYGRTSPDAVNNPYVVVKTSRNGIVVSTPFSSGSSSGKWVCSKCGKEYNSQYDGYWPLCEVSGEQCNKYLVYVEAPKDPNYDGNGIKFTTDKHTKIQITFKGDPKLTAASFGENPDVQPDGSCKYYANNALSNGVEKGPNIYGAFPK